MVPVILALKANPNFECVVLATAQHRELLDQVLSLFNIVPDYDLNAMEPNQTLTKLSSKLLISLDECLKEIKPNIVLAQGDTTTVLMSAMSAFYNNIPFGHIEAGLRTGDMLNPFPEEMNRVLTGHLSKWHFAPTISSKENLLAEGIDENKIIITGNTVIDTLHSVSERDNLPVPDYPEGKKLILVTAHRRENFGEPFKNICQAIRKIADEYPEVFIYFPVHPNPNIKSVVNEYLGDHSSIKLTDPLDYLPFVGAMNACEFIISDSGGVQEEAPALGKPVLVLREETERPEAISEGVVKLVGTNPAKIYEEAKRLIEDKDYYKEMAKGVSPYGDGQASDRIVKALTT